MTTHDEDKIIAQQARIEQLTNFIKYTNWEFTLVLRPKKPFAGWQRFPAGDIEGEVDQMSTEQQRKMMECAAKACGLSVKPMEIKNVTAQGDDRFIGLLADEWPRGWFDPLTNPTDTAEMCAKLGICTLFFDIEQKVSCGFLAQDEGPTLAHIEPYGDSRLKAWMCAATMVAAKIGDLE